MKTALLAKLTEEQKTLLVDHILQRIEAMESEREGDWKAKRERYEKMADGDYDWRPTYKDESKDRNIFDLSNRTIHPVRGVIRFIFARLVKDFFGSSPWFSVNPHGGAATQSTDPELASQVQPHAKYKLDQSKHVEMSREAIQAALELGECPVKTTWRVTEDEYEQLAMVLVDKASKEPVLTELGDYIYDTDATMEVVPQIAETADNPFPAAMDYESGEMIAEDPSIMPETMEPTAPMLVFEKAPEITFDDSVEFQERLVTEKTRLYSGLEEVAMHWKDVLWPLNCHNIDQGDIVVVRTNVRLSAIVAQFSPDPDSQTEEFKAIIAQLKTSGGDPKTEAARPKPGEGESKSTDIEDPFIQLSECYVTHDAFKDGKPRRMYLAIDEDSRQVIWGDYLANISPRSQCPIHVWTVGKVKGRAYGRGLYEVYEELQEVLEQLLNAMLYRNSQNADPVKVFNPHLTKEGATDENVTLSPGQTLTARTQGIRAEDILSLVNLPNLDSFTWEMMQMFLQVIQVESGVTNASQGNLSSLPSNSTASGINSMLESSSVAHQLLLEELRSGMKAQLRYAIELLYFSQDEDETYEFLEGNASGVLSLKNAKALAKFPMDVDITLTRAKNQSTREAAMAFIPQAVSFFQLLRSDPVAAQYLQPVFVSVGKGLEIPDADSRFPSPEDIQAMIDQQAAQAAAMQEQAAAMEAQAMQGLDPGQESVPALPDNVVPG